jgi:hypothetical protein
MPEDKLDYTKAMPNFDNIKKANKLYDDGNIIIYWTARGRKSGIDYRKITENQLKEWNVKYHELKLDKPYDLIIDDRSLHPREWK